MASPDEQDLFIVQAVRIAALIERQREKHPLTQEEQQELDEWLNIQESNVKLYESLQNRQQLIEELEALMQYDENSAVSTIFKELRQKPPSILKRRRTIMIRWSVAASLLLFISAASWFYLLRDRSGAPARLSAMGIKHGTDKAMLTLQDGQQVVLDGERTRSLGIQGAASVQQQQDRIVYINLGNGANAYNTVTTPRGGQYRLGLADGSEVWLNAASSITFPTTFGGNAREVAISGEAYFKVVKDSSKPFIVSARGMKVRVVGTEFNVMAYEDEDAIRTTLVNGIVKINHTGVNSAQQLTLQPGEQAALFSQSEIMHIEKPTIETVTAWHFGQFNFRETNIKAIMRQVARWYDVKVEYRGSMPDFGFSGQISRKESIEDLLGILSDTRNVDFEIKDDKTIVVTARSQQSKTVENSQSRQMNKIFSAAPGEILRLPSNPGGDQAITLLTERKSWLCTLNQAAKILHGRCRSIRHWL